MKIRPWAVATLLVGSLGCRAPKEIDKPGVQVSGDALERHELALVGVPCRPERWVFTSGEQDGEVLQRASLAMRTSFCDAQMTADGQPTWSALGPRLIAGEVVLGDAGGKRARLFLDRASMRLIAKGQAGEMLAIAEVRADGSIQSERELVWMVGSREFDPLRYKPSVDDERSWLLVRN